MCIDYLGCLPRRRAESVKGKSKAASLSFIFEPAYCYQQKLNDYQKRIIQCLSSGQLYKICISGLGLSQSMKQIYLCNLGWVRLLRHYIYLTLIQMQSEQNLARSKRDSTEESEESNVWSESHQVYYYSKFDLFDQGEEEFYIFSSFLEKVSTELGREWKKEANFLYSPYFTSRQIFMTLMELWLSHHPPVNSHRCLKAKQTTFNSIYLAEFKGKMQQELSLKSSTAFLEPPNTSAKAVCLGFFMTANEIWEDMFQNQATEQKTNLFSSNNFIRSVTNSLEKTFRPLMVVTQKIGSVFGRKKRKFNEEVNMQESAQSKFESCYHEFKRTLDIEKQIERKMSDLILDDQREVKSKIIEKKEFEECESPIQTTIIGNLYSYVSNFLHRNPSWQVASNFVTQILDLNQVKMEEGKKVKVMRPAQDFYKKLVMVWLIFQQNNEESVTFPIYLNRLKASFFADTWQDKYIVPTKYFYERMKQDWHSIKQQTSPLLHSEKEIMTSFIRRIKKSMQNQWDHKIIMKQQRESKKQFEQ